MVPVGSTKWSGLRGNGIYRFMSRRHATVQRNRLDWDIVFNPNSSRRRAINQFKRNLLYLADKNLTPRKGSQESKAIGYLSYQGAKSTRQLCEMVMQHRINEHELWEAILKATRRDAANITVPREIRTFDSAQLKRQPVLEITPETVDHLEDVIDRVEKTKATKASPADELVIFDGPKPKNNMSSGRPSGVKNIDVKSLGHYLQKAGKHGEQRKRYTWENQRNFSWEQATNEAFVLSPGGVLFPGSIYKRYKKKPLEVLKLKAAAIFASSKKPPRYEQDKPTELLVYNLVEKKQRVIPLTDDSSLFNINYKDLFGIINSSRNAPEETLSVINQFEGEGWTLIGDLYDNSQTIAFQRTVPSNTRNIEKSLIKNPWLWTAFLSAFLYSLYSFQPSLSSSDDVPVEDEGSTNKTKLV